MSYTLTTHGGRFSEMLPVALPGEIGIDSLNLKASTPGTGQIVDLSDFSEFTLFFKAVVTGAAAVGTAKVQVELFDRANVQILGLTDLWTGITPYATAGSNYHACAFGRCRVGAADVGTIAVGANIINCASWARFTLVATANSDAATSCLGSLLLRART